MNLAIVISVSEYIDTRNNLPGCRKDADCINSILNKTGKFDEILFINEKLSSGKVKEKLTAFISEHKSKKIEELFFYYTGHGEFQNEEFYYLLSDYSQDKKNQTTLQNEEVDSLFRTLNPELVIKVIDACQSGKAYIKEAGAITKYFQKTIDRFDRCYFLNSSLKDQSSFQTDEISDFTLSFINSIKEHDTSEIRYKDIMDFISDAFEKNTSQTPFFVVQADYTEKFCIISKALKEYLNTLDTTLTEETENKAVEISLLEKIKRQASEYFTKEQAIAIINKLKGKLSEYKLPDGLNEIYDIAITFQENYDGIVNKNAIGKWLDDNLHEYFAKSSHTRERKDRYTNILGGLQAASFLSRIGDDTEYEWVRNGFELEVEVPFKTIIFTLNSKFPNIESYTARVVYLLSKKQIRFFYFITNFETKNWDERKLNTKIEWLTSEYPLKDEEKIIEGLNKIFAQLTDKVKKEIEEKFANKEGSKE
ncbi:caspase family protein [Pedobacter borealis]|uniref:caspase family protein n=1 Tax=Pedobacter borealis TaxID=475254 RepID=UPI0004938A2E|nr:caspase family protein [Pedobacter borealis]